MIARALVVMIVAGTSIGVIAFVAARVLAAFAGIEAQL